ncbi:Spectrin alpha chain, non-erythrocytic 1 [Lemmus lemmus]
MQEKGIKLLQAQKLMWYLRECEDVMDWINDKEQHPEEELIKTKQDEVNAAWQRLKGLALQRQGKLFGAAEVQCFNSSVTSECLKFNSLVSLPSPTCLPTPATTQKMLQVHSLLLYRAFLLNEDLGDSLDSVEALLKKHEDFEKSLSAQEEISQ